MKMKITILLILGVALISCNDTISLSHSNADLEKISQDNAQVSESICFTSKDGRDTCKASIFNLTKNSPNIFGRDPLILSMGSGDIETDELPILLNQLQRAESINELREVYKKYHFYSPIIESHLLLDSLITAIDSKYQSKQSEDSIHHMLVNLVTNSNKYSKMISLYQTDASNCSIETCTVEPIGTIGFRALGNDKDLLILGSNVYKFYDAEKSILCAPIEVYIDYSEATYEDWQMIQNEFSNNQIRITSTNNNQVNSRSLSNDIYTSGVVSEVDADGKYTLEISYSSTYYQAAPYIIAECPITIRCFGGIKSKTHMNLSWECNIGLIVDHGSYVGPWNGWRYHGDSRTADQVYARSFSIPNLTVMANQASLIDENGYPIAAGFRDIYVYAHSWKGIEVVLNCPDRTN